MKKLVLLVVAIFGVLALPGTASAHYPVITGTAVCNDDGTWEVTWTVHPDAPRPGLTWEITSSTDYSPAGAQSAALPFTRTATYTGAPRSVTESVGALWSDGLGGFTAAKVILPDNCQTPTTTTTTTTTTTPATTTTTTTTSVPDTTTTTTTPDTTTTSTTTPASTTTTTTLPATSSTTSTTEPATTTTEPEIGEIPPLSTTTTTSTPDGTTTTTVAPGATTTTQPTGEIPAVTTPDTPTGPTGPDAPTLPVTGSSGTNDVASLALLLITVGAYTLIGLHGHRRQPELN